MPPRSPNIILIMADQLRADCLEPLNSTIKTPNLQRLADEGVLFTRMYAPTPVCLPCRTSVLTGQYPSTHGATHNESHLPQDYYSSVASMLSKAGYRTHIIGKSHFNTVHDKNSPESPPHIFNYDFFKHWHGPWYGFQHANICVGHTTETIAASMHYGAWLEDHGIDIEKYFGNTDYTAYGAWDLPEQYHASSWVAETTISAIERCKTDDRPFFFWVNFPDPHNPCMVPEPWASMYDPTEIKQHGFKDGEPESFNSKPPFYKEIINQEGAYMAKPSDPGLPGSGNVVALGWNHEKVQENAACYYGMVSLMDKYIGKIINALEEHGLLDDTVLVFTADHGDFLGDHGFHYKSVIGFEEAMNVPLIVRYPPLIPRGVKSGALHSSVDLTATFLSIAGIEPPPFMEGVNQASTWEDPGNSSRESVIIEERPYDTDFNLRVVIHGKYKLCFYAGREYGELYDMDADPDQLHNLWDDPECKETRIKLLSIGLGHEMNKKDPNLDPSSMKLLGVSKAILDAPTTLHDSGKLVQDDNGAPFLLMTAHGFGTHLIDIPLAEILEDVLANPIQLIIESREETHQLEGMFLADDDDTLNFLDDSGKKVPFLDLPSISLNREYSFLVHEIALGGRGKTETQWQVTLRRLF
ncbi:sulfatase-like hydrolase/transferase [Candidatus Bathyarchaeota archaeon]|nr:sulfatase-like hydrolase/transferase [Candidatus Bathyarchaeota archaeon]